MKKLLKPAVLQKRLKKIKLLILDVDGILTDGSIFYIEGQGWTRIYNIYDGYGIRLLRRAGFPVGVMSGGNSNELKERVKSLGIEHAILGSEDKLASLEQLKKVTGFTDDQICFMADDLFDLPALRKVGLAVTVPTAAPEVIKEAHFVTKREGGRGAVREFIDLLRKAQNIHPAP